MVVNFNRTEKSFFFVLRESMVIFGCTQKNINHHLTTDSSLLNFDERITIFLQPSLYQTVRVGNFDLFHVRLENVPKRPTEWFIAGIDVTNFMNKFRESWRKVAIKSTKITQEKTLEGEGLFSWKMTTTPKGRSTSTNRNQ